MTRSASTRDLTGRTVVFLHAHPDDEAIFTGVTMRRLADRGARVVLVTATGGEEGLPLAPLPPGRSLAEVRVAELEQACGELGVARLVLLRYRDSGMAGTAANAHPRAFTGHSARAAGWLAELVHREGAEAVVHYDSGGIYGHPDHVGVHVLGRAAARLAGVLDYEATVAREGLPTAGRHLVEGDRPRTLRSLIGRSVAQVQTAVRADVGELSAKRAAMAAHASQVPVASLATGVFAAAYAAEWYLREGPPGILDHVGDSVDEALVG